jgi:hypothetical protein
MTKFTCNTCNQEFQSELVLNKHINKKYNCNNNKPDNNTILSLIDIKSEELRIDSDILKLKKEKDELLQLKNDISHNF